MKNLQRKKNLFSQVFSEKHVQWIEQELVGEIGFTKWTSGNKLRHPRFLGLLYDKDPKKVVREKTES